MKESGEEEEDGDEEPGEEQRPEGESLTLCIKSGGVSAVNYQSRCTEVLTHDLRRFFCSNEACTREPSGSSSSSAPFSLPLSSPFRPSAPS